MRFRLYTGDWWEYLARVEVAAVVGADGICLTYQYVRPRLQFIPFAEVVCVGVVSKWQIDAIDFRRERISIETSGGRAITVLAYPMVGLTAPDFVSYANSQLARFRAHAENGLPQLQRGERAVGEWLTSLLAMERAGGYRTTVSAEALFGVLDNPRCRPEERAAAAVALLASLGSGARQRLCGAIAECASPELRSALEDIEAGDSAVVAGALARISSAS